jgi:hypothetical protein
VVTPPYEKDGNAATFNAEERADIVAIWRAVAEDYAPFDVDVRSLGGLAGGRAGGRAACAGRCSCSSSPGHRSLALSRLPLRPRCR